MITHVTDVLPMLANVFPMVTNVYSMVAKESSVSNPQKVAKIDEKSEKWNKHELATLL
jgi:hypothetical protein